MADYDSSFPIRTENPGDVISRIADATTPSQQLTVNPDGSINVVATSADLDIRDLSSAQDSVEVLQATHDNLNANANIQVGNADVANGNPVPVSDAGGSITVDAVNLDIRDLTFATDKVDVSGSDITATVTATDLDIRDLAFVTDKVDVSGSAVTVSATNLDIRDLTHASDSIKIGDGTDFLAINTDGSINVVPQEDPGTEVIDYNTASAVAAAATSNHDLTVTNASRLYQVCASASGKLKIQVQIETGAATGVFNTIGVLFNSTATPNIDLNLAKFATIPAGARVRVIRTNRDLNPLDVYSTIIAIES